MKALMRFTGKEILEEMATKMWNYLKRVCITGERYNILFQDTIGKTYMLRECNFKFTSNIVESAFLPLALAPTYRLHQSK